ncbi:hypothetical protein CR513_13509, partial [Mucuna pruriens]
MDMAPDCSQLQNMAKGEKEAFKGYARHWRELATCIQPPLSDKEMERVVKFCESTPHRREGGSKDEEKEDCARGPYQLILRQ